MYLLFPWLALELQSVAEKEFVSLRDQSPHFQTLLAFSPDSPSELPVESNSNKL